MSKLEDLQEKIKDFMYSRLVEMDGQNAVYIQFRDLKTRDQEKKILKIVEELDLKINIAEEGLLISEFGYES